MSTEINEQVPPPQHSPKRSASNPKPKGILKNAPQLPNSGGHSLQWDEENIALTEIQKDSLMKITEPKTPYVRYNALTDEIEGEIPMLDLNGRYVMPGTPSGMSSPSTTGADTSGPSSRRTSVSSNGRPSGRSGSGNSSRSTSFNLPDDARKGIRADQEGRDQGEEVEFEEEMDEETAQKHAAFVRARGRHYSQEAEAMKLAAKLAAEEDEAAEDDEPEEIPPMPKMNGIGH
ncbi:hypothetical protein C8J56DRAFT_1047649 [Mycena floridula]|nr:hypothetical protein C8J56DRAFT_1047649 [Mycena floridula]